jgi:superfamily II DNA or RNA helicase
MVERRAHVAILAHYLKLEGIDAKIIMGKTTPKKLNKEIKKEFPKYISSDVIKLFREYDMDKEFEITRELAYHKKAKVILTTQKGFIGMSIKTIDVGIIATPTGMSLELFNQKVGRVERSYGDDKYLLDRFGVKPTPIVEYIWDVRIPPLKRSGQNIIDEYPRKSSVI